MFSSCEMNLLAKIAQIFHSRLKGVRLVFSSSEARLLDERTRKNAKMAPFNLNGGARDGT